MKIFISYGRDMYGFVVERVVSDLNRDFGDENVLFDKKLNVGRNFDNEISEMLDDADWVLFFMTPHSTRKIESVCLDEISYARAKKTPILPIMLVDSTTPLLVSRIQWLDMRGVFNDKTIVEANYAKAYASIAEILNGKKTLDHEGLQKELINLCEPFDFSSQLTAGNDIYTSRPVLQQKVADWIGQNNKPFFWITGNPGTGKSVFSSWCTMSLEGVIGVHFCSYYLPQTCDCKRMLKHLAYHLCLQSAEYEEYLLSNIDFHSFSDMTVSEVFYTLFIKAAGAIASKQNLALIIDGIDELEPAGIKELSAAFFTNRNYLPPWLKFMFTSRPEHTILNQFSFITPINIYGKDDMSELDIYIRKLLAERNIDIPDESINRVLQYSDGSYLYVSSIVDSVSREGIGCIEHLPEGMSAIFTKYFDRQSVKYQKPEITKALLQTMCAAKEPLTYEELAQIIDVSEYDIHSAVNEFGALLLSSDNVVRFYHKQLKDWLEDKNNARYWVSTAEGSRLITDWISNFSDDFIFNDYMISYGFAHLAQEGRYDVMYNLLAEKDETIADAFLDNMLDLAAAAKFSIVFKAIKHLCSDYPTVSFSPRRFIKQLVECGHYNESSKYIQSVFSHSADWQWLSVYAKLIHHRISGNITEVRELCNSPIWDGAPDDVRADIAFYLGESCRENGSMEIATGYYKKAIELSAAFPDNSANYLSKLKLIDIAYVEGNLDFALKELTVLRVSDRLKRANYLKARLLGHVKEAMGAFDEAKNHYLASLSVAKSIKHNFFIMESLNSIGGVCFDYDEGMRYLADAKKIALAGNYRLEYGKNLYFTARLYLEYAKTTEALLSARESIDVLTDVGYAPGVAAARMYYAIALYNSGEYAQAEEQLIECNRIYNMENIYPHLHLFAVDRLVKTRRKLFKFDNADIDMASLAEGNKNLGYMRKFLDDTTHNILVSKIISAYLTARNATAYSIGYHNKNYIIEADGQKFAVREPVEDFETVDIRVYSENDMLGMAKELMPFLEAPRYIDTVDVGDCTVSIHSYVCGQSLTSLYGTIEPLEDRFAELLAARIAKMHLATPPEELVKNLPYTNVKEFFEFDRSFLTNLITKWYGRLETFYKTLGLPGTDVLLAEGDYALTERPFAICHCDIHRGNLLWDEQKSEMHFIDWELVQIADPVYDIAIHFHKMHYTPGQEARFLEVYRQITNIDLPDMERQIDFYRRMEEVKSNIIDGIRAIIETHEEYDDFSKMIAERHMFKLNYLSKRFGFALKINSPRDLHDVFLSYKPTVFDIIKR